MGELKNGAHLGVWILSGLLLACGSESKCEDCGADATLPDGGDGSDAGSSDGGDNGDPGSEKWDFGNPIDAPAEEWTWVEFPGTRCMRSDKPVGIAINPAPENSPNGDKVHIWMEGGGACFNATTCSPPEWVKLLSGEDAFAAHVLGYDEGDVATTIATARNLNREAADNPFKDWNLVMVPYCSGDLHSGRGATFGNATYTGYSNMTEYLKRIVPTFENADEVVLSGSSAGGFGALQNFEQVQSAFADAPVHLLQDSSPFLSGDAMSACGQKKLRDAWDMEPIFPAECTNCADPEKGGLASLHSTLMEKYPDNRFGLIASTGDETLRFFWGESMSGCPLPDMSESTQVIVLPPFIIRSVSPPTMAAAVADLETTHFSDQDNGHLFVMPTVRHVFLNTMQGPTVNGVELADWIADFVADDKSWTTQLPP